MIGEEEAIEVDGSLNKQTAKFDPACALLLSLLMDQNHKEVLRNNNLLYVQITLRPQEP